MEIGGGVSRGDVFLVDLNPARGGEIRKTRPCVVVSPDELNAHLRTFIVAPLTTGGHPYPFRVSCRFQGKLGRVVLDQIRTCGSREAGQASRAPRAGDGWQGVGCTPRDVRSVVEKPGS